MQPGEMVVVRLKDGAKITRCLGSAGSRREGGDRVRISVGRNREARLPLDRIILATGVIASNEDTEAFEHRCDAVASEIDLFGLWTVLRDQYTRLDLDDLTDLYWGPYYDLDQKVALLLSLDRSPLYFISDNGGYSARSEKSVQDTLDRRQRERERAQAATSLIERLSQGSLPNEMSSHQSTLLGHLRGYAVHGDNYTKASAARDLLRQVETGTSDFQQRSFDLLAEAGVFHTDEPIELERADITEDFSAAALAEASTIDNLIAVDAPHRRDLTTISTITIDDANTDDRDDALSLESESPRIYRVGIHIADAAALITPGGAVDQEANQRMATLYMPERKVPMVPHRISSVLGSLMPEERRATLSLLVRIEESGDILDWKVVPAIIRSQAALSYEEVDQAIVDSSQPRHYMLTYLHRIAELLRSKRKEAGAIILEQPEMSLRVSPSGKISVNVIPRSTPARQMVSEFMILCNSLLAEFSHSQGFPTTYRSQVAPDIKDEVEDLQNGPLRRYMIMRRFPPADLDLTPAPHGALGVPIYIHVTSPLRRYPDLMMQRQITHFLNTGHAFYSANTMESLAQRAEIQLRELSRLEESRRRYWFLKYLSELISRADGDEDVSRFEATVLANQMTRPTIMELVDYPFRIRAKIPPSCIPGERVVLRLHSVDLWRRVGQFTYEHKA